MGNIQAYSEPYEIETIRTSNLKYKWKNKINKKSYHVMLFLSQSDHLQSAPMWGRDRSSHTASTARTIRETLKRVYHKVGKN